MNQRSAKRRKAPGISNDMNIVKRHTKPNPQLGITG